MNCREFESRWNDLLDDRPDEAEGLDADLESHASSCLGCRAVSARYQVLRQAVAAFGPPPAPSPGSIERLYALTVPSKAPAIPFGPRTGRCQRWWTPAAVAAAAALALACFVAGRWPEIEPDGRPLRASSPVASPRPLGRALAEATEATLELAREASAPASRIGRELLDLGRDSTGAGALPSGRVGDGGPTVETDSAAPGVFGSVGRRVGAGVEPISGSARHAFSFLLGPAAGPGQEPIARPARDSL